MKLLPTISLAFALSLVGIMPTTASTSAAAELFNAMEQSYISVVVKSSTLRVKGAAGQTLLIYNVTGMLVKSIKIDGSDCSFDVNLPHGCYIVKVGKWVRKVFVR